MQSHQGMMTPRFVKKPESLRKIQREQQEKCDVDDMSKMNRNMNVYALNTTSMAPLANATDKFFAASHMEKFNSANILGAFSNKYVDYVQSFNQSRNPNSDKEFTYSFPSLYPTVPRLMFDDNVRINNCYAVRIDAVGDISKFWMYKIDGNFREIDTNIQIFFGIFAAGLKILEAFLVQGQYCIVFHMKKFHRAKIVSLLPVDPGLTKVFLIDQGNVEIIRTSNIYHLPFFFATHPYQVIRARLTQLYPPEEGMPWSLECTKRFIALTKDKVLLARVKNIDHENQALDIELDLKTPNNIFSIRSVLIKEGFAVASERERRKRPSAWKSPKNFHIFPDFYDIEMGKIFSLKELVFIIDSYMNHYTFCYSNIEKPINGLQLFEHVRNCGNSNRAKQIKRQAALPVEKNEINVKQSETGARKKETAGKNEETAAVKENEAAIKNEETTVKKNEAVVKNKETIVQENEGAVEKEKSTNPFFNNVKYKEITNPFLKMFYTNWFNQ